ncbi:MAG: hypothetical protein A2934_03635 [Candidatus Sungbacteria bacterium RIFCSPLOWO2_01_FULL_47_10]|uniref:Glycosidase n=1 Tax=Candidatus Sungbacteria bacterium RIFCSPLOWO2_01_FULL_47_10 TaxID=1802276 RepID=A0A1G2L797_9BACT|nr:MAG: hypothetical protein A2934_03635 [Candidatus Sungbacteria bacterium RIFCSPLOWO2_01_FULL_47_10]
MKRHPAPRKRVIPRAQRSVRIKKKPKVVSKSLSSLRQLFKKKTEAVHGPLLRKFVGNPILQPNPSREWESRATFNPAALYLGGKTHLLYRAIGDSDVSVFGYASSTDGVHIDEQLDEPAYVPREPFEGVRKEADQPVSSGGQKPYVVYSSGGGTSGGCEDPRLTRIDDQIYMLYVAFDGWSPPRVALTSILVDDFLAHRWNWKKPVLISPPGQIHKNWVLFPEKIDGKFAILHSICPEVSVSYFDSLDFDGSTHIQSAYSGKGRQTCWDNWMRGVGAPPIRTREGWLVLYHAMDVNDPGKYKLGAMILDVNDPSKIIYRSNEPILEPQEWYENEGWKWGVIYTCGAAVIKGRLFVYYGAADAVIAVATAELDQFVAELKRTGTPKLLPSARISLKKQRRG